MPLNGVGIVFTRVHCGAIREACGIRTTVRSTTSAVDLIRRAAGIGGRRLTRPRKERSRCRGTRQNVSSDRSGSNNLRYPA